jgi:hypothetical protein
MDHAHHGVARLGSGARGRARSSALPVQGVGLSPRAARRRPAALLSRRERWPPPLPEGKVAASARSSHQRTPRRPAGPASRSGDVQGARSDRRSSRPRCSHAPGCQKAWAPRAPAALLPVAVTRAGGGAGAPPGRGHAQRRPHARRKGWSGVRSWRSSTPWSWSHGHGSRELRSAPAPSARGRASSGAPSGRGSVEREECAPPGDGWPGGGAVAGVGAVEGGGWANRRHGVVIRPAESTAATRMRSPRRPCQ